MSLTAEPARVIMRAALHEASCTVIGSAFELEPSSVFVATDREFPEPRARAKTRFGH